jgi:cell division protein FtsI/penicillin-binding protein 2
MSKSKRSNRKQARARAHHNRLRLLVLSFLLLALGYTARLVQLQVLDSEEWRARSQQQNAERAQVPAPRGSIYDRSGAQLARGSRDYRAYLAPAELKNQASTVEAVGRALGLSRQEEAKLRMASSGWEPSIRCSSERIRKGRWPVRCSAPSTSRAVASLVSRPSSIHC